MIGIVLLLASLACDLSNPTPVSWVLTPTAQAQAYTATAYAATQAAAVVPIVSLTPAPNGAPPTATPPATTLSALGPWLVYPSSGGQALVVRNVDGSAAMAITIPPLLYASDLTRGLSPAGGVIAFRTGLRSQPAETALYLLYLPEGRLKRLTPLFSESEQALVQAGQDARAADTAVGVMRADSLAWSPDGRILAFIGALDRNASDLYLYDTQTGLTSRMTFGSNMVATPFWSTNSQSVITQEVISFTAGSSAAAWQLGDVWTTDAQTGISTRLYTPPLGSVGEVFTGWETDSSLLAYSRSSAGNADLRQINLKPFKSITLLSGPFDALAFDPTSRVIAFTHSQSGAGSGRLAAGLYLLTQDKLDPQLVQAGNWQGLSWSVDGGEFMAYGPQGVIGVAPDGTPTLISGEIQIAPSPHGSWLAGWGGSSLNGKPGLRLYRSGGALIQTVTSDPVQEMTWQPDAKGLFLITGTRLELVTFPTLQPVVLDPDLKPGVTPGLVWVSHG